MALKFDCCFPYRPNYMPPICCCCWICRQHIPEKMKLAGSMTQTHTRVCDVDIIRKKKKRKKINNKGRSITEIHVKSFGTSRCCVYKRRFFWWVGSPSQELITSQWIHWAPATFYKTKTATRRRHKRKKDFPKSIRPRWWESSQKKKRENNNESEWENCLQPRDFSRKKVGIFIFYFFSLFLLHFALACVCVCCTLISIRTPGPLSFALPVFLVLY
jgi:hypothetical protein